MVDLDAQGAASFILRLDGGDEAGAKRFWKGEAGPALVRGSDALVMAQSKGWLMGQGGDPSGRPDGSRNTNFSLPAFFDYYSSANNQYLQDGVQFFWVRGGAACSAAPQGARAPAPCALTSAGSLTLFFLTHTHTPLRAPQTR